MNDAVALRCPSVEPELMTSDSAAVMLRTLKSPVASVALRIAAVTGSVELGAAPALVLTLHVRAFPATENARDRFWTEPAIPIGSPISASDARWLVNAVFP